MSISLTPIGVGNTNWGVQVDEYWKTINDAFMGTNTGSYGNGVIGPLRVTSAAFGTYAGVNSPPANGVIVSGSIGIGTAAPSNLVTIQGNASVPAADTNALLYVRNIFSSG